MHDIRSDERPHDQIALDFGVGLSSVSNIKNLIEWSWLPVDPSHKPFVAHLGDRIWGESHYCAKLDEDKVIHIRRSGEPNPGAGREVRRRIQHCARRADRQDLRIPLAANENDPRLIPDSASYMARYTA